MEEPIRNPYVDIPGYDCFGCSPTNPRGLRMRFVRDGDSVFCRWSPSSHFQGYKQVLHGGVQSTLMDETASWLVFVVLGTAGVTSGLSVRFLKPVFVDRGDITVRAHLLRRESRVAFIQVDLYSGDGEICSTGECEYALYSPEVARRRLNYPGSDAFLTSY